MTMDTGVEKMGELDYNVCNNKNTSNCTQVTTIDLNIFQLWFMFGIAPRLFFNGKTGYLNGLNMYEYTIVSKHGYIFTVYAWGTRLIDIKKWKIASNCKDQVEIQNFLEYLFESLKCYSKYYRSIEYGMFESDNSSVNECMKRIEEELSEKMCMLTTM